MVALCFLSRKSVASEHFKNCFCWESRGYISWDPFFPSFLYLWILHHTDSVNLDSMAMGKVGTSILSGNCPPPQDSLCVPRVGLSVPTPISLNGMLSRDWVLCRTSLPTPCHLVTRGTRAQAGSLSLVDTGTPSWPLGSAICRSRPLGHQLTVYASSSHISSFFAPEDFLFFPSRSIMYLIILYCVPSSISMHLELGVMMMGRGTTCLP